MRILLQSKIIILIFISCTFSTAYGKNLLMPAESMTHTQNNSSGLFFGLGMNYELGSYLTSVCKCEFEDGIGKDYLLGVFYEKEIANPISFGVAFGLNLKTLISSYINIETLVFSTNSSDKKETIPVRFRYKAETNFTYLPLIPYIKWQPYKIIFFRLGLNTSLLFYSNLKNTKEIIDSTVKLNTGEIVPISFSNGSNVLTIENNNFTGIKSILFFMEPSVGFNINIYNNLIFSPIYQLSLPLTKIDNSEDNFKIINWKIILELRYEY